jgi:hypothetical protein
MTWLNDAEEKERALYYRELQRAVTQQVPVVDTLVAQLERDLQRRVKNTERYLAECHLDTRWESLRKNDS